MSSGIPRRNTFFVNCSSLGNERSYLFIAVGNIFFFSPGPDGLQQPDETEVLAQLYVSEDVPYIGVSMGIS